MNIKKIGGGILGAGLIGSPVIIDKLDDLENKKNKITQEEDINFNSEEDAINYGVQTQMILNQIAAAGSNSGGFEGAGLNGEWDGKFYKDPNTKMVLSSKAIGVILHFEVGADPNTGEFTSYSRGFEKAVNPKGDSGATIGIGYDLGHKNQAEIRRDWAPFVSPSMLNILASAAGITGGGQSVTNKVNQINSAGFNVPMENARIIFMNTTLKKWCNTATRYYPNIEKTHPHTQGALISLIFNRGSKFDSNRTRHKGFIRNDLKAGRVPTPNHWTDQSQIWIGTSIYNGIRRRRDFEGGLAALGLQEQNFLLNVPYYDTMQPNFNSIAPTQ